MKTVLITGCSSGVGRLAAQRFAASRWNVVATARKPESLADLAGPTVAALRLDVTDEASIAAAVDAAVARFGTIDVLVNNAGYGLFGPLEGMSTADLQRQFDVNVLGLAAVTRAVLPVMRQQRGGAIVNMSSLGGRFTSPFLCAYYSSKFAGEGLSEALAFELKAYGIRVKLIEPAHFKTEFIARSLQSVGHEAYDRQAGNMRLWMTDMDRKAPDPAPIIDAIYRAATDGSSRLRYPVRGRIALALHAVMPRSWWNAMMAGGLNRRPKAA